MTKYPAQIDTSVTLPSAVDNFTPVAGATVNRLRDAVLAIEAELGVKPSGVYGTVRGRLDTIENALSVKGGIISLAQDLGGTYPLPFVIGLQGRPLSSATPTVGQFITWDGYTWKPTYGLPSSFLTQAHWYVDWNIGNDSNPGTQALPVKTVMGGIVPKWGTSRPVLPQNTTVHMVNSQPLNGEKIIIEPTMINESTFTIVGTPKLSISKTLGAVTAKNRSTKTLLQAAGFTGYTVGQMVVNNTHPSHAIIIAIAGDIATLAQPLVPLINGVDTAYWPTPAEVDTWTVGDSISIYDLPLVNLIDVTCKGSEMNPTYSVGGILWIESVYVPDQSGTPGVTTFLPAFAAGLVMLQDVWVQAYFMTSPIGFVSTLVNCLLQWGAQFDYTMMLGGAVSNFGVQFEVVNWIDADAIIDAASANSGFLYSGLLCIDATGSLIMHPGSSMEIRQNVLPATGFIWGAGALNLQGNSSVVRRLPTASWATSLNITTLTLPGNATTGTAYNSITGLWTSGIALTSANLDGYHGLQDPRAGARFCEDL